MDLIFWIAWGIAGSEVRMVDLQEMHSVVFLQGFFG
jgi:hypothetical protein